MNTLRIDDSLLTVRSRILKSSKYRLLEKIGQGGMSEVWRAQDLQDGRVVAVKILDERYANDDPEIVESFRQEAQLMAEVKSPFIVSAYDLEFTNRRWFIAMEYVDGYTFQQRLDRKGRIEEPECLLICESLARALNHLWNDHGIVHCDIKPANIMINSEGIVKLTDLGISRRFQRFSSGIKALDSVLGTPAYMSPEQVYADVELDCRTDVYALGATLYHLVTGHTLFPGVGSDATMISHTDDRKQAPDPRIDNPWISEGFVRLLESMLVKDRNFRISSWSYIYETCMDIEQKRKIAPRKDTGAVSSMSMLA